MRPYDKCETHFRWRCEKCGVKHSQRKRLAKKSALQLAQVKVYTVMNNIDFGDPPKAAFTTKELAQAFCDKEGEESPGLPKFVVWPEDRLEVRSE